MCQSPCSLAEQEAISDFHNNNYILHSAPFSPDDNTYLYVLRNYYNIQWRFISSDSTDYYSCYDSTMLMSLNRKLGFDLTKKASKIADSLEHTSHWNLEPEFPGGKQEMYKYIIENLVINAADLDEGEVLDKLYVLFTITTEGMLEDIRVHKAQNQSVNKKVVELFSSMPKWRPAYKYGKPAKITYSVPLTIEVK